MSQPVLSIDLSSSRPRAVLTRVADGRISVNLTLDLPPASAPSNGEVGHVVRDLSALKSLAKEHQIPWYRTALLVPGSRSLAVSITLPFSDEKNIRRVLENEVQDLVPFDVSEFSLQHQVIGKKGPNEFEILVTMLPRVEYQNILDELELQEIRPRIVTSSVGVAAGLVHMMHDYCTPNCILVLLGEHESPAVFRLNGSVRLVKLFPDCNQQTELASQLRLAMIAFEKQQGQEVERIYFVHSTQLELDTQALAQHLARPVESIKLNELVPEANEQDSTAALASYLASDLDIPVLNNLRGSELGYLPLFIELLRGLKPSLPYMLGALAAIILGLSTLYIVRASRIDSLSQAIEQRIAGLLPPEKAAGTLNLELLKNERHQLESDLKELGSLSKLSPLDAFLELSRDLPISETQVSIYSVAFRDNRITVKGTAPSISSIERVEQIIKAKGGSFCEINSRNDSSVAPGNAQYGFELVIGLC